MKIRENENLNLVSNFYKRISISKYFNLFTIILTINYLITFSFCYYCCGKYPKNSSDCNSLSNFAYQCCYLEGSNIASSILRYQVCYGFSAGKDPTEQPEPKFSPYIKIDVLECGTPHPYAIKKTDLCGIDSPGNFTICASYGSNCCYLKYFGDSFCLDKYTFNAEANNVELECSGNYYKFFYFGNKFNFSNLFFILTFIIYLIY